MLDLEGLFGVPRIGNVRSRSISAENPDGQKGGGGRSASPLGVGRKGRPSITLAPGSTTTIADIEGPGIIRHLWFTVTDQTEHHHFVLRDLVLRMFWDGEDTPSVEVPLGDFFCCGFGQRALVSSIPIVVAPAGGMNSWFAMPFERRAVITISNEHPAEIADFFYQVDYALVDSLAEDSGRFHAQWRRSRSTEPRVDHVIVDAVRGRGMYVGTYLGVTALERFWWGEGEVKFFIDGDSDYPTISGTGLEDYVGGAWSFQERTGDDLVPTTYSSAWAGYPFRSTRDDTRSSPFDPSMPPSHGLYRWHLPDPIHFDSDLRVTVQQIGHDGSRLVERSDDVSSVAYWYQLEPHAPFPPFPDAAARRPR